MAISFDIYTAYQVKYPLYRVVENERVTVDHPEYGEGIAYRLSGPVGDWLVERGHDATFIYWPKNLGRPDNPNYELRFNDHNLATLFKLTWM